MAKRLEQARPTMSRETRDRLRRLLEAVPPHATEADPALIALLEAWRAEVPYEAGAHLQAARAQGGRWLMADVDRVLAFIRRQMTP